MRKGFEGLHAAVSERPDPAPRLAPTRPALLKSNFLAVPRFFLGGLLLDFGASWVSCDLLCDDP
jgi:hypothetical protein